VSFGAGVGAVLLGYRLTTPVNTPAFTEPQCTVYIHRVVRHPLTRTVAR
jgi:hypothetical protein